jgi:hypothetical protein
LLKPTTQTLELAGGGGGNQTRVARVAVTVTGSGIRNGRSGIVTGKKSNVLFGPVNRIETVHWRVKVMTNLSSCTMPFNINNRLAGVMRTDHGINKGAFLRRHSKERRAAFGSEFRRSSQTCSAFNFKFRARKQDIYVYYTLIRKI